MEKEKDKEGGSGVGEKKRQENNVGWLWHLDEISELKLQFEGKNSH